MTRKKAKKMHHKNHGGESWNTLQHISNDNIKRLTGEKNCILVKYSAHLCFELGCESERALWYLGAFPDRPRRTQLTSVFLLWQNLFILKNKKGPKTTFNPSPPPMSLKFCRLPLKTVKFPIWIRVQGNRPSWVYPWKRIEGGWMLRIQF